LDTFGAGPGPFKGANTGVESSEGAVGAWAGKEAGAGGGPEEGGGTGAEGSAGSSSKVINGASLGC